MHTQTSVNQPTPVASWLAAGRPAEACRILLLSEETAWTMSFKGLSRQMAWRVKRLNSPVDALAHVHEFDPHLIIVGPYDSRDLTLTDMCDALRIPRQLRPLAMLVTTDAPVHVGEDMAELGVDEVLDHEQSAEAFTSSLLQHFRLSVAQRTVLDREREILDSLPQALAVVDRDLAMWQTNHAFAVMYDIRPPEMLRRFLGQPLAEALSNAGHDETGRLGSALAAAIREVLQSSSTNFHCREDWKDRQRALAGTITPLANSSAHVLITVSDVTDHEQMLKREARRERLATLGNLAVGVAHEIQNPNTFSRVNASNLRALVDGLRPLLDRATKEQPDLRIGNMTVEDVLARLKAAIDGVAMASSRIASVVDTLKTFGAERTSETEAADVHAVIMEAAVLTEHECREHVILTLDVPTKLPHVRGDAAELTQVFVNLIENAVHAIAEAAPGTCAGNPPEIRISLAEQDDEHVVVSVADNGPGISETTQAKIFRPYYTTREQGQGLGLGLSISAEILHRSGGDLTVRSRPGQGASFLMTLQRVNP